MSRAIEFRAWDKKTKTMHEDQEAKYWLSQGFLSPEYMQYTGLKDRNGVKIFEGDILRVDWQDKRYPVHTIGPVIWDIHNACWQLGEGGSPERDAHNHFEVIGNIHQNPELLK